jgi:hypothetical protein
MSPQASTAAKAANIATTQMETINESMGMGLTSYDEGNMPARLHSGFDLNQIDRGSAELFMPRP